VTALVKKVAQRLFSFSGFRLLLPGAALLIATAPVAWGDSITCGDNGSSGNWNSSSTWGGCIPNDSDGTEYQVFITDPVTITADISPTISMLVLAGDPGNPPLPTLNLNGHTLTTTGSNGGSFVSDGLLENGTINGQHSVLTFQASQSSELVAQNVTLSGSGLNQWLSGTMQDVVNNAPGDPGNFHYGIAIGPLEGGGGSNVTLQGSGATLASGTGTWAVLDGNSLTLAQVITGSFLQNGDEALTLTAGGGINGGSGMFLGARSQVLATPSGGTPVLSGLITLGLDDSGKGQFTLQTNANLALSNATVNNGVFVGDGTGTLLGTGTNAITNGSLTGVSYSGAGTLGLSGGFALNGGSYSGAGQINTSGAVSVNGIANSTTMMFSGGTATVTGTNTNNGGSMIAGNGGVLDITGTVSGGTLGAASGGQVIISNQTLSNAMVNNGTFTFSGNTLNNVAYSGSGNLNLSGGTTISGGSYTGTGNVNISDAASLSGVTNSTAITVTNGTAAISGITTNTGGTMSAGIGGTLQVTGLVVGGQLTTTGTGQITSAGASMFGVTNAGSANYSISGTVAASGADWTVGAGNSTTVVSGGNLNESGNVNNNGGAVMVNTGGVLQANTYTQTAGSTQIDGSLEIGSLASPGSIDIEGGTFTYSGNSNILGSILGSESGQVFLEGNSDIFGNVSLNAGSSMTGDHTISGNFNGTTAANVTNSGSVTPGDDPGTDIINGNYQQTSTGWLNIELGGTDPADYSQLVVNGTANLSGTLDVTLFGGFQVQAGDAFQIVTDTSTIGNFSNFVMPDLGPGLILAESQDASGILLTAEQGPQTPEPASFVLFGGALMAFLLLRNYLAGGRRLKGIDIPIA